MIYKILMILGLLAMFLYVLADKRRWASLEKKAHKDTLELELHYSKEVLSLNSRLARTAHVAMCGYATLLVIPIAWLSMLFGEYIKTGAINKVASLILIVLIYMVLHLIREERNKYLRYMSSVTSFIALAYETADDDALVVDNLDSLPLVDYNMVMDGIRSDLKASLNQTNNINL